MVCAWSVVFAAPHLYWAAGGRRGLGAAAASADEALAQGWFAAYNLGVGVLAVAVAIGTAAVVVDPGRVPDRLLRWGTWAGCLVLAGRGVIGVVDLAVRFHRGTVDSPPILLAVELWFLVGAVVFAGLATSLRRRPAGAWPGSGAAHDASP